MVQLAGISVPDPIDHYIKERLRADKYVRFMDDSWICHHDKTQLEKWREAIRTKYDADGMKLHPTKTKIVRLQDGSWKKSHAAKGNSKKLLQRMNEYVKYLLEGIA
nr:MAG TPA: hypothetical protein [Caudoviricetes sp.]